nr:MAG TPA_asm: hypothetical protein [Caudoviricetes sp.]
MYKQVRTERKTMAMKYNKRILKQHTENIFGKYYTLYILDNKDYTTYT